MSERVDRARESISVVMLLVSATMLFHAVARGESDSCNFNVCLNILYYNSCANPGQIGKALLWEDCLSCVQNGRCAAFSGLGECEETTKGQSLGVTTVYDECDCDILPNASQVEASGSLASDYKPTGTNQFKCMGGS